MKKIGMRNFKTGIAVFLCIITLRLLKVEYPFYACIAAVICMQSSVFDSFKVGKNRMIGTFIGALIGLLFALIEPRNAFLCFLGIIVVIYVCNMLGRNKSATIACIVFLAIMINLKDTTPLLYSANRLMETFIGIAISVLVNYFISPPKYLESLSAMKNSVIDSIYGLLKNELCENTSLELSTLNKQVSAFEDLLKLYMSEIASKEIKPHETKSFNKVLALSKKAYSHLFMIKSLNVDCSLNKKNKDRIVELFDMCNIDTSNKPYENNDIEIIYNYHINNLIDIVDTLKTNLN